MDEVLIAPGGRRFRGGVERWRNKKKLYRRTDDEITWLCYNSLYTVTTVFIVRG